MFTARVTFVALFLCLALTLSNGWYQASECAPLRAPLKGSVRVKYLNFKRTAAVANYSCEKGYYLDSLFAHRQCWSGKWLGNFPQCEKSDCPVLDFPSSGGSVKLLLRKTVGLAVYRCNDNFRMVGNRLRRCTEGYWVGEVPTCVVNDVSDLVWSGCHFGAAPEFGVGPQVTSTNDGSWIATYSCWKGYRLTGGPGAVICKDGKLYGTVPSCHLDVFGTGNQVCNFSEVSDGCHYVNEVNSSYQWEIVKTAPTCASPAVDNPVKGPFGNPGHNVPVMPPLTSIHLRPLPPALQTIVDGIKLPFPLQLGHQHSQTKTRSIVDFDSDPTCSPVTVTTLILRLPGAGPAQQPTNNPTGIGNLINEHDVQSPQYSEIVGVHLPKPILGDATFEIGPLSSSFARYIKFSVDAPANALAYAVFVAGHCLPDPPGSMYPVHLTQPVFDVNDFSQTFCLNLYSHVRCRSPGSFVFSLRISLHFLYVGDQPQSVRFRPKGAFENFSDARCLGSKAVNE